LHRYTTENNIQWHGHHPNEPSWDEENRYVVGGCYKSNSVDP
jgi:hypothetical protein